MMISRSWLVSLSLVFSFLALVAVMVAAGCQPSPAPPVTPGSGNAPSISFAKDILPIFDVQCVTCHQGPGRAGLVLQPAVAYKNLVGVASTESQLQRVAPGSPDKSYLLNKLKGTQSQVGGAGQQMPFGGLPLPQAQIDSIQQWIAQGAPNN